jgi:ferredoxin
MIVAERKPLAEIQALLGDARRVLVVGCGACVAVCMAGGEKEAGVLAAQLKLAAGVEGRELEVDQTALERQCDREFLQPLSRTVEDYDAVVSLACGAGVQLLAEAYPDSPVYPGVNTQFIGVAEEAGRWTERCRACGQCLLGLTGGICPVTMCSKSLLNGPCGGPVADHCETDFTRPCAWVMIYERLKARGRLDLLTKVRPPLNNIGLHRPNRLTHEAYQRKYTVDDEEV